MAKLSKVWLRSAGNLTVSTTISLPIRCVRRTLADEQTLLCATPSLRPGYATVEFSVNAQDYTTSGAQVQYVQVGLRALQPASGPQTGATRVVLTGVNLLDAFGCLFGGQPAAAVETLGRGRLACVTPPFTSAGWVVVQLIEANRTLAR